MQYHCHVYCKMGGGEGRGGSIDLLARGISPLHQELLIKSSRILAVKQSILSYDKLKAFFKNSCSSRAPSVLFFLMYQFAQV